MDINSRIRALNDRKVDPERSFVLYWMIANRRPDWNFALDRAVELGRDLGKPVVVLEAIRSDYPWASRRITDFVRAGMAHNRERLEGTALLYHPYVEPEPGAGRGLLAALAERACAVVTDDYPCFFLPRMVEAAAAKAPVRLEAVDANGLLPMRAADRDYPTAYAFRRFLQKALPDHLEARPRAQAFRGSLPTARLPEEIARRWPAADLADVAPADAAGVWTRFLNERLENYLERRNVPDEAGSSGLSPHLHFGHISAHRVFHDLAKHEEWTPERLAPTADGGRRGWWGMSEGAEAFLDQLVTWRELGFNMCAHRDDYDRYESLPPWARETLEQHEGDPREHVYTLAEFDAAETHDELWNAAQRQLVREGVIHNYLRMLWGKKILEWTESPRRALEVMIELNNKHALDGRDPNSYSGIFWCLGRYDRPWGPERPVFGKIRYMTSKNTARKFAVKEYLERYGA